MADLRTLTVSSGTGIPEGTVIETKEGKLDVVVKTRPIWQIAVVRIARIYGQSFLGMYGLVTSGIAPDTLVAPHDFFGRVALAAGFALAPAGGVLITNLVELLVKWDK